MVERDVIVIGGGISGAAFAWHAAGAGREVLILERRDRLGGCMDSVRLGDGFWFEMGAHTAYNSYGGMLEIIEGAGLLPELLPRLKAPFRVLRDGELQSIGKQLDYLELITSAWRILTLRKAGLTVQDYYGALVGRGNYERFFSSMLSAVPCQRADAFPAAMLFKKRPRRKDIPRSYTLRGGLQGVVEGAARRDGVSVRLGAEVEAVCRRGEGFEVRTAAGETLRARDVAVALPPRAAAGVLAGDFASLSGALGEIDEAKLHTTGVVVPARATALERVAGIIPARDVFFSAVSRDMVPDDRRRAFAFHFKPGVPGDERMARIRQVLGVEAADIEAIHERDRTLPSPVRGHDRTVARVEAALRETGLHLAGNYFAGMALEDCVARAGREAARMARA